ncbi:MAG: 5-formyltetrahydrofolate cyclo-ligase [Clostridia bacterium]|nr:5-formyltetrahydrofolate cyclo-ligase [Clostridia bacterium]
MMDKDALRRAMRERRRALSRPEQQAASQAVLAHLRAFEPYRQAKTVMAYMACRGELSLTLVIEDAFAAGKTLLLPRCEAPGEMTARRIDSLSQLRRGCFGLEEPDEACFIAAPQEIDLILVPGTAFDTAGRRLGQGGGYYDRFLLKTRAVRVGICHDFAILERVPAAAHDEYMDILVSPAGVIRAEKNTSDHRRSRDGE